MVRNCATRLACCSAEARRQLRATAMRVMCSKSNMGSTFASISCAKSVGRSAAASLRITASTSVVSALISTSGRAGAGACATALAAARMPAARPVASAVRTGLFPELQVVFDRAHAANRAGDLDCLVHLVAARDVAAELHHVLRGLDVDLQHFQRGLGEDRGLDL